MRGFPSCFFLCAKKSESFDSPLEHESHQRIMGLRATKKGGGIPIFLLEQSAAVMAKENWPVRSPTVLHTEGFV